MKRFPMETVSDLDLIEILTDYPYFYNFFYFFISNNDSDIYFPISWIGSFMMIFNRGCFLNRMSHL